MARLARSLILGFMFGVAACETPEPCPPRSTVSGDPFLVFFAYASVELSPQARATIKDAASVAKGARVFVTGHTDSAGDPDSNLMLSERRAEAVKRALVKAGLNPDQISTAGRGEKRLLVETGPGVRDPQNRRVEFTIFSPVDAKTISREEALRCSPPERR